MPSASSSSSSSSSSPSSGYKEPPWKFQGSALYQFHLVKSEIARALVPKEFRLVEAFGYTLGGFFLASYEDSPAGVFDELVVMAGIVWNPPTSCAWASRVLVSSNEACHHGRKQVGLPSHFANFSKTTMTSNKEDGPIGFFGRLGQTFSQSTLHTTTTQVAQPDDSFRHIFSINLIKSVPQDSSKAWMGPSVKMSLPSFSGRTEDNPCLLKYSCQMACRVRLVKPLRVTPPSYTDIDGTKDKGAKTMDRTTSTSELSVLIMLSKPVLALEFNCMSMNVEAPLVIANQ